MFQKYICSDAKQQSIFLIEKEVYKRCMTTAGTKVYYLRCLIFEIPPTLFLNILKNLTSFKIGAYRLVLIKDIACI